MQYHIDIPYGYDIKRLTKDDIIRTIDLSKMARRGIIFTWIKLSLFVWQNMSYQAIKSYITHLPTFRVMICRFCEVCIPSKDSFRHYKDNHSAKKDHYISMEIRYKIAEYMTTLDLCQSQEVRIPNEQVSELKIIKEGFRCNFLGCDACGTSEHSMHTHYYIHQKHISKDFKNWELTALQTFFDGQHRKYVKLFISALMVGISQ